MRAHPHTNTRPSPPTTHIIHATTRSHAIKHHKQRQKNTRKAKKDALATSETLKIVMAGMDMPVSNLSGGNAQKVVIGKWLQRGPHILLLNDPTKGVDVGTKNEFYTLLKELSKQGTTNPRRRL